MCRDYNGVISKILGDEWVNLRILSIQNLEAHQHDQQAALGKALWHQVLTVVILRQNMRQISQTVEDSRLWTALENMQYRKCTANDLAFLNTHVSSTTRGRVHIS